MKILMLCLGNICRSPLAVGILREKLSGDHRVDSAGTIAMHEGKKADQRSIDIAAHYGTDITSHRAQPIAIEHLDYYDRIYCMDQQNLIDVKALCRTDDQRSKLRLILDENPNSKYCEVPDPYWGTVADFDNVYKMLDEVCDRIARDIN